LQVATEGKKEEVSAFLSAMVSLLANFAAEPRAVADKVVHGLPVTAVPEASFARSDASAGSGLLEQHYEIAEGATGYTYERIFRPYIDTATTIQVEDPYIRSTHQVDNFTRFCALAVRLGSVEVIELVTGVQPNECTDDADSRLETLRRDLLSRDVAFNWVRKERLHDREIHFSNGWIVKIGRGLDIYQRPESWVSVEAVDFSIRRCRSTKVDIFRESGALADNSIQRTQ
jgi:ATP-dependent Lon protease